MKAVREIVVSKLQDAGAVVSAGPCTGRTYELAFRSELAGPEYATYVQFSGSTVAVDVSVHPEDNSIMIIHVTKDLPSVLRCK